MFASIVKISIVIVALAGTLLLTRGKWAGFVLWLISNGWWCWYNIKAAEYAQAFLYGAFWLLSVYGIYSWKGLELRRAGELKDAKTKAAVNTSMMTKLLHENVVMAKHISGQPRKQINTPGPKKARKQKLRCRRKKRR